MKYHHRGQDLHHQGFSLHSSSSRWGALAKYDPSMRFLGKGRYDIYWKQVPPDQSARLRILKVGSHHCSREANMDFCTLTHSHCTVSCHHWRQFICHAKLTTCLWSQNDIVIGVDDERTGPCKKSLPRMIPEWQDPWKINVCMDDGHQTLTAWDSLLFVLAANVNDESKLRSSQTGINLQIKHSMVAWWSSSSMPQTSPRKGSGSISSCWKPVWTAWSGSCPTSPSTCPGIAHGRQTVPIPQKFKVKHCAWNLNTWLTQQRFLTTTAVEALICDTFRSYGLSDSTHPDWSPAYSQPATLVGALGQTAIETNNRQEIGP